MNFQFIRRNEDGTVKIEYQKTTYMDWTIPKDENGNELRGLDLRNELIKQLSVLDRPDEIFVPDPEILNELGVMQSTNILSPAINAQTIDEISSFVENILSSNTSTQST